MHGTAAERHAATITARLIELDHGNPTATARDALELIALSRRLSSAAVMIANGGDDRRTRDARKAQIARAEQRRDRLATSMAATARHYGLTVHLSGLGCARLQSAGRDHWDMSV